jgi:ubiquitin carboxyl-terminal hydrolase 5/13
VLAGVCSRLTHECRQTKFGTFPSVLVLHAKKFQLVGWVPTKLDIPVTFLEDDVLVLDEFAGTGLQAGEEALPEDAPGTCCSFFSSLIPPFFIVAYGR